MTVDQQARAGALQLHPRHLTAEHVPMPEFRYKFARSRGALPTHPLTERARAGRRVAATPRLGPPVSSPHFRPAFCHHPGRKTFGLPNETGAGSLLRVRPLFALSEYRVQLLFNPGHAIV